MTLAIVEEAWRNRWFAKDRLIEKIDFYIETNSAWLLEEQALRQYSPSCLWKQLPLIVLFGQVPRNSYRVTPKTYQGDPTAPPLALNPARQQIPFHFRSTIAICLSHAESERVQQLLSLYVPPKPIHALEKALLKIFMKHKERVQEFECFPKRNHVSKITETPRENVQLLQLQSIGVLQI
jgi:uncharacterized protein (DUF924 family)